MQFHPSHGKRWNIFARELEDILKVHRLKLSHLESKIGIHPEKINRLKRSLDVPSFPLLNPEELEDVVITFKFTTEEQLRLRAAILATAIEKTLMNRIDPDNAFAAAEEIFPLLLTALHSRLDQHVGIAATR